MREARGGEEGEGTGATGGEGPQAAHPEAEDPELRSCLNQNQM